MNRGPDAPKIRDATRSDTTTARAHGSSTSPPTERHAMTLDDRVLRPLTNDDWGFESNCFVCEPRNQSGLRIPFFHDAESRTVVAEFTLDGRFSGAPRYVHGGVILALLDEAMAWATIAIAQRFAVTAETTTEFGRPVRLDRPHKVRAWIEASEGNDLLTAAEIIRDDGVRCATARARFAALDLEHVSDATGTPIAGPVSDSTAPA